MKTKHCNKCSYETEEGLVVSGCAYCGCHIMKKTKKEIKEAIKLARKEIAEWSLFIKRMGEMLKEK